MRFLLSEKRGFTLIEVLVISAIIAILAMVVMSNVQEGRKKAHDVQRISDLGQLQVALRTYRDVNSVRSPDGEPYDSGVAIGGGSALDGFLAPYLTGTIQDPTEGNYYYNSNYTCNGVSHIVLVASTMERASAGNFATVCGAGPYGAIATGVTPTTDSYIVIVK